jgi:outer membrane protein OmpA-like peptidoglycan-associated protein
MASNLLESVTGLLTPDLIGKAASMLGESETGVSKAFSAIGPAVLQGVLSNAATDNGAGILDMAKQAAGSGLLDNIGGLFNAGNTNMMSLGSTLLSGLFGSKTSGIANLVASFAGIKPSSSNSLMSAIAPMALSLIGKHAISNNLSAGSLLSWLTGQKDSINKAIPAGFNFASVFDGNVGKAAEAARSTFREPVREPETSGGLPKWLLPLLLLALGALALWYFLKGCNNKTEEVAATVDSVKTEVVTAIDTAASKAVEAVKEAFNVSLPGGVTLNALKGGIEDQLVGCINDAACIPGKDKWFNFDNLNFETNSAKITAESQAQVNNIAAILKAFPKAKIKIGGYTDKSGDAAANKKLSQERADAVTAAVIAAGANKDQLEKAEGYGSEFATVDAKASDAERKVDRKISVSLRAK